jgi:hypothetical protein
MSLVEYLKSLTQMEREQLAHMGGCTGAYVTSIIYKNHTTTSLALAVAVDKMSKGEIDFRELINRTEDVDWGYVEQALVSRPEIVFEVDTCED